MDSMSTALDTSAGLTKQVVLRTAQLMESWELRAYRAALNRAERLGDDDALIKLEGYVFDGVEYCDDYIVLHLHWEYLYWNYGAQETITYHWQYELPWDDFFTNEKEQ